MPQPLRKCVLENRPHIYCLLIWVGWVSSGCFISVLQTLSFQVNVRPWYWNNNREVISESQFLACKSGMVAGYTIPAYMLSELWRECDKREFVRRFRVTTLLVYRYSIREIPPEITLMNIKKDCENIRAYFICSQEGCPKKESSNNSVVKCLLVLLVILKGAFLVLDDLLVNG